MSDIQQLEQEILQDAQSNAENILKEAKKEANEILSQAKNKSGEIKRKVEQENREKQEIEVQRELSRIRINNKIELENLKESLVQEIFDDSINKIRSMREQKDQRYLNALSELIILSGTILEGGEMNITLHPDDSEIIDKNSLEAEIAKKTGTTTKLNVSSSEEDLVNGGVISQKGSLIVNNTFNAVFDRRKEAIRNKLSSAIFNEGS
ncbi:MAG: V-type ATP synthase subunit E [Candidatus Hodarchaeales archaeon]|jgi:V/A-type H+-transporting ATPase subunit E